MIVIPFSFLPINILRRLSRGFYLIGDSLSKKVPDLKLSLEQAEIKIRPNEYVSMCLTSTVIFFIVFGILTSLVLAKLNINILIGIVILLIVTIFLFIQQLLYPKLKASRRIRGLERNLIPALQNLLIQLDAGVPIFNAIATISDSDYGEVSEQFKIAVRKINAGRPEIDVLEDLARNNPSFHFRRTLWQIANGLKTGSDMGDVIKLSIENLSEEQLIQIQQYGSQLNPLAMFYMMVAVILPSLGVTFILVISSFVSLTTGLTKLIFWGLLVVVFFFQLMFLGIIKTRRPNLLE